MTTGGGQTRFNPNLYQDGKVCLSLLGNWHASNESEKWNPKVSSLAQVLVAIQTQILVSEPYFNEPGYEVRRGTQVGHEGSKQYNSKLKLATLRYAILGQLKTPPCGLEEVCKRHFSFSRKRILAQARRWTLEAQGSAIYQRFEKVYQELLIHLSCKEMEKYNALPPLKDDLCALEDLDPSFVREVIPTSHIDSPISSTEDKKPSASTEAVTLVAESTSLYASNPWSSLTTDHSSAVTASEENERNQNGGGDDIDDELYL